MNCCDSMVQPHAWKARCETWHCDRQKKKDRGYELMWQHSATPAWKTKYETERQINKKMEAMNWCGNTVLCQSWKKKMRLTLSMTDREIKRRWRLRTDVAARCCTMHEKQDETDTVNDRQRNKKKMEATNWCGSTVLHHAWKTRWDWHCQWQTEK